MITPAFSLTSTERVLPRLALDFTTASLDPRVTITRPLNTATVTNSSGIIVIADANTPRFDYDFATLTCRGLLIEQLRANLLLNSVFAGGGAAPTSFTQPIGTGTSAPVTSIRTNTGAAYSQTATSQRPFLSQAVSLLNSVTYTLSIVIESVSGGLVNSAILGIEGQSPSFFANGSSVLAAAEAVPGVLSAVFTNTSGAASYQCYMGIGPFAAFTGSVQFSCPQLEQFASFATSYIPTTTISVTRNTDVAVMTGTNFSDWYNATEGTLVANVVAFGTGGARMVQFDNGEADRIQLAFEDAPLMNYAVVYGGGVSAYFPVARTSAAKIAAAYKANDFAVSYNGGTVQTDTTGNVPTVNAMRLGLASNGGEPLNGHIQSFRYWPQRLTNAELQAFSKP